jgi:hypothetical protein
VTASITRSGFENASKGMATAKMRGDGEYGSMTGVSHGRIASGGVLAGGWRCRVACSYPYTILINVGSLHARPRT